ncbi:hypothetical protein VTK26DRAFT_4705 [Humicola hyalothermophila]
MAILSLLRPSDILVLSRVSKSLREFILMDEARVAKNIIHLRYSILERCLLRPVLLRDVDLAIQPLLTSPDRRDIRLSQRNVFQNIPRPDNSLICTCLTCLVRWDILCVAVDFAHWQDHLDKGEPIPAIPRGTFPSWNQELIARNARIVSKALTSPLWYARILDTHLESTVRSIRRHSQNKADKRPHFHMTDEDVRAGTDVFLQRQGPPFFDYIFSRDAYYMLEAFLPGRSWITEQNKWVYVANGQQWHERDLELVVKAAAPNRETRGS